jgi:hypothetical protein
MIHGASRMRWSPRYALLFAVLLTIEFAIALHVRDRFVRPFVGDALVVALIYCAVRAVVDLRPRVAAAGVLAFACSVEVAQWLGLAERLPLEHLPAVRVALGTHFDPLDFVAYSAGALVVLSAERGACRRLARAKVPE